MNKRGISLWIEFVLLMAFAVGLSIFLNNWMKDYTLKTTETIKERNYNTELCDGVAISIDAACQSNSTQSNSTPINLYINVTNRGNLRITKQILRIYDNITTLANWEVHENTLLIKPGRMMRISNTSSLDYVGYIEVVPVTEKGDLEIVCAEKKAFINSVKNC